MNWIGLINIIIVNIIVLLALSYFWSGWNFKVFKPWIWLELRKRKQLQKDIEDGERQTQDKNRYYIHWFAMEQIDTNHVEGSMIFAGIEDDAIVLTANRHSPERNIIVVDPFENRKVEIVRENCQGEVSRQEIDINSIDLEDIKKDIGKSSNVEYLKGEIAQEIKKIEGKIAFASIDTVDYNDLSTSLAQIYPLMSEGAILIVHDYNHNWESVRKAVDNFEASVNSRFLWLPDMYGSIAMVKGRQ